MTNKIHFAVVTPERSVIETEVDEITAPGWEGEFGVLPNHAPFMAIIRSGELMYRQGNERNYMAVGFGFVEVLPEKVTVLIETAEKEEEIDVERAIAARDRALNVLSGKVVDADFEAARAALMRALSRIRVAEKRRGLGERHFKRPGGH
jgi:F-type H+-transporting ATPase subunit epsilon